MGAKYASIQNLLLKHQDQYFSAQYLLNDFQKDPIITRSGHLQDPVYDDLHGFYQRYYAIAKNNLTNTVLDRLQAYEHTTLELLAYLDNLPRVRGQEDYDDLPTHSSKTGIPQMANVSRSLELLKNRLLKHWWDLRVYLSI